MWQGVRGLFSLGYVLFCLFLLYGQSFRWRFGLDISGACTFNSWRAFMWAWCTSRHRLLADLMRFFLHLRAFVIHCFGWPPLWGHDWLSPQFNIKAHHSFLHFGTVISRLLQRLERVGKCLSWAGLRAGHSVKMWGMSSVVALHRGHVGSTSCWLNLARFDSRMYEPVNIFAL